MTLSETEHLLNDHTGKKQQGKTNTHLVPLCLILSLELFHCNRMLFSLEIDVDSLTLQFLRKKQQPLLLYCIRLLGKRDTNSAHKCQKAEFSKQQYNSYYKASIFYQEHTAANAPTMPVVMCSGFSTITHVHRVALFEFRLFAAHF